ncbi:MAG: branched-chain amino acid ABC transporter permease [Verrucomicrobia bacterium]|nr:MAG: branched-chain amino acid ABC transporter permease [Verrucomicrobiota bacterium]
MQFVVNGIITGSIYALVGISFALIYVPTKFFHFTHGAIFASGAYVCYACHVFLKLPLWTAILLALGASALGGFGLELYVFRALRRRGATHLVLLLASLGFYIALQNTTSLIFGDETRSLRSLEAAQNIVVWGAHITQIQLGIILAAIALSSSIWVTMKFTRFGKALRAVAGDPKLAEVCGINVDQMILLAFAIGSAVAGVSAILVALEIGVTPTMGLTALMGGIVAMIIGGVTSIPATLLGGLLLGLAQHLGVWKIGSQWQDAIAFLILAVFLLVRPQGFFGKPHKMAAI